MLCQGLRVGDGRFLFIFVVDDIDSIFNVVMFLVRLVDYGENIDYQDYVYYYGKCFLLIFEFESLSFGEVVQIGFFVKESFC